MKLLHTALLLWTFFIASTIQASQEKTHSKSNVFETISATSSQTAGYEKQETFEITLEEFDNGDILRKRRKIGSAKCSYDPTLQVAELGQLDIQRESQNKGYGTYLLKRSIGQLYSKFSCKKMNWLAQSLYSMNDEEAFKRVLVFYSRVGAQIIQQDPLFHQARMTYPLHLAVLLALFPPNLPNEQTKQGNDEPFTIIIEYLQEST